MQLNTNHFNNHIQNANISQPYILSSSTFPVDRIIFSDFYPDLKGTRFRLYLLMCRVAGFNNGEFFMSYQTAGKELNVSKNQIKKELDWLESHYFIKYVGNKGRSKRFKILTVPDYYGKQYFSNDHIKRDRNTLKNTFRGYVELPTTLFSGSILRDKSHWTDAKIKLIGKIYQYFWLDEFGGVQKEIAYIDQNKSLHIDKGMIRDIGYSLTHAEKFIAQLIQKGELLMVDTIYRKNTFSYIGEFQYIGDIGTILHDSNDDIVTLIRPKHLSQYKLDKALKRIWGGII